MVAALADVALIAVRQSLDDPFGGDGSDRRFDLPHGRVLAAGGQELGQEGHEEDDAFRVERCDEIGIGEQLPARRWLVGDAWLDFGKAGTELLETQIEQVQTPG